MYKQVTLAVVLALCSIASAVPTKQYSGYIPVNPQYNANMFYWMFESQNSPSTDPLVLWMTGGPGCSSELALFFENGPYTVNNDFSLSENKFGWNQFSNLLYVDQPVGTGFSYANQDYVTNETSVDTDMYTFLQGFFAKYPQYAKLDFYIIGESYGGHYVPSLAARIVAENQNSSNPQIHLKGVGIGNGWVDPYTQYAAYGPFAIANNLIDNNVYATINQSVQTCQGEISNQQWNAAENDCGNIMQEVLQAAGNINVYNIQLQCNPAPLCYNFDVITAYLNLAKTQQSLGVQGNIQWEACSDSVNEMFGVDREESFAFDVPTLLNSGIRVLVYSGKLDLICNYFGGVAWTNAINWPGQNAFINTPLHSWKVGTQVAGQAKSAQGLTWLQVEAAGHMVPHDQPAAALALLKTFLNNQPF